MGKDQGRGRSKAAGIRNAAWRIKGDTNNPRHLIVTQDLDIEGIFLPDNYSIVLQSNNPHYGTTSGAGSYPYGTLVTLTAIPSDH